MLLYSVLEVVRINHLSLVTPSWSHIRKSRRAQRASTEVFAWPLSASQWAGSLASSAEPKRVFSLVAFSCLSQLLMDGLSAVNPSMYLKLKDTEGRKVNNWKGFGMNSFTLCRPPSEATFAVLVVLYGKLAPSPAYPCCQLERLNVERRKTFYQ